MESIPEGIYTIDTTQPDVEEKFWDMFTNGVNKQGKEVASTYIIE